MAAELTFAERLRVHAAAGWPLELRLTPEDARALARAIAAEQAAASARDRAIALLADGRHRLDVAEAELRRVQWWAGVVIVFSAALIAGKAVASVLHGMGAA